MLTLSPPTAQRTAASAEVQHFLSWLDQDEDYDYEFDEGDMSESDERTLTATANSSSGLKTMVTSPIVLGILHILVLQLLVKKIIPQRTIISTKLI